MGGSWLEVGFVSNVGIREFCTAFSSKEVLGTYIASR